MLIIRLRNTKQVNTVRISFKIIYDDENISYNKYADGLPILSHKQLRIIIILINCE